MNMNTTLRKLALFVGLGILGVSMYFSQDGFNFDVAGDSGYASAALFIGWFLAVAVSVIEFVFSSNYKDLNPSLILFGILAYAYSIYTNYEGIIHFQGASQSLWGARILAVVMDGVAEPLIAWGLYESGAGDFIGNLLKAFSSSPNKHVEQGHINKGGFQEKPVFNQQIPNDLVQRLINSGNNQGNSDKFQNLHRVNHPNNRNR